MLALNELLDYKGLLTFQVNSAYIILSSLFVWDFLKWGPIVINLLAFWGMKYLIMS